MHTFLYVKKNRSTRYTDATSIVLWPWQSHSIICRAIRTPCCRLCRSFSTQVREIIIYWWYVLLLCTDKHSPRLQLMAWMTTLLSTFDKNNHVRPLLVHLTYHTICRVPTKKYDAKAMSWKFKHALWYDGKQYRGSTNMHYWWHSSIKCIEIGKPFNNFSGLTILRLLQRWQNLEASLNWFYRTGLLPKCSPI